MRVAPALQSTQISEPSSVCHHEPRSRYHPTVLIIDTMMGKTLLLDSMIPCIRALPAAPAPTSEARSWLQDATTAAEQRNIELRTRSHLLSSVDPVPYGDTNGPTHAPAVVSLAPSAAAVPAFSLGPWWIVRCIWLTSVWRSAWIKCTKIAGQCALSGIKKMHPAGNNQARCAASLRSGCMFMYPWQHGVATHSKPKPRQRQPTSNCSGG